MAEPVVPGDLVANPELRAGPGVYAPPQAVPTALAAGRPGATRHATYVEQDSKRYVPAERDAVIGIVTQRLGDVYRVSLQPLSRPVRLDHMAFEAATRKNKPNLQPGDVVYARVTAADPLTEAEIEAFDSSTGKAAGFGQLKGGTLTAVGLAFARHLLYKGHPVLEAIGAKTAFEIAIGVNGKLWIKGPDERTTLQISKWIAAAETMSAAEAVRNVR